MVPPSPELAPARARLVAIDALRGLAALLVLLSHLPTATGPWAPLRPLQAVGHTGVGLFLVLSGFSIHYRWAQREEQGGFDRPAFAARRFWRLYPTYAAAVGLAIVIAAILGDWPHGFVWGPDDSSEPVVVAIVAQLLVGLANVVHTPLVGVSWSLGLEIQLYAIYSIVVERIRRIGAVNLVFIALALSLAWRVASELFVTSMPVGQFFADGSSTDASRLLFAQVPARAFEWYLGVLAAEAYCGRVALPKWTRRAPLAIGSLLIAAAAFRHQMGAVSLRGHGFYMSDIGLDAAFGIGYFVLTNWLIHRSWSFGPAALAERALAGVGIFSYSLYLTHPSLLALGGEAMHRSGMPPATAIPLLALTSVACAYLFFLAFEKPFLNRRSARRRRLEARPVTVGA
jgi:peptidoglycan/LPS O-acetylase OafA/YrhL